MYRLYWGTASSDYDNFATIQNAGLYPSDHDQVVCSLSNSEITCTVDGLVNNTRYYFALSMVNENEAESELSNETVVFVKDDTGLDAPDNLVAAGMDGQVQLEWDEVIGASGYKVYFKAGAGCDNTIDFPPDCYARSQDVDTDTAIIISGLTNGNTYYFAVTAYDEYGNEDIYSDEASAVPTELEMSIIASGEIVLTWEFSGGTYTIYLTEIP